MEWKTQTYRFQSSRRFRRASGGALAKKREREREKREQTRHRQGSSRGGQNVAGGTSGTTWWWNGGGEWLVSVTRAGTAALRHFLAWATLAVTCGCSPFSPPYRLRHETTYLYFYTFVVWPWPYATVVKDTNHRRPNRSPPLHLCHGWVMQRGLAG